MPRLRQFALTASLALFAGCGGSPSEIDSAEVVRDPAKSAPSPETTPTPTPEASPAKDAPKG